MDANAFATMSMITITLMTTIISTYLQLSAQLHFINVVDWLSLSVSTSVATKGSNNVELVCKHRGHKPY